jgi:hypothetical protein
MVNSSNAALMCEFDAHTFKCYRCGYLAKRLPTYRVCRTITEMAQQIATDHATKRISIPPIAIGTSAAKALSFVGITPRRVKKVIGKDCGCDKRKATLDNFGAAVSSVIERAANGILNAVLPSPVGADDVAAIANSLQASQFTNAGLKDGPGSIRLTALPR